MRRRFRSKSGWACPNVKLKTAEFNWIGRVAPSVNMTFVMANVPVKTIQDTFKREILLGASARSSTVAIYPAVLSNVIGAKFKLVMGYPSSTASMLAMERGEVEGHSTSLEVVRATHPEWLPEKKVTPLVQYALNRHPELPNVPMSWELAQNDVDRQILRIVANATEVGKMILSTPDTPADRIQALRRAFDATMKDPAFQAELKAQRVELGPMPGEELQKLVVELGSRVAGDHRQGEGDLSAELTGLPCSDRLPFRSQSSRCCLRPRLRSRLRTSIAARPSA